MGGPLLKSVGYWADGDFILWPDPRWLVRRQWRAADRPRIVRYLRLAATLLGGMPSSYCWFGCFPIGSAGAMRELGGRTLTDGEWQWPEGLAHYVECHSVRLPDEFVATMAANRWEPPTNPELPAAVRTAMLHGGVRFDPWPWVWWGLRYGGPFAWMPGLKDFSEVDSPHDEEGD